MTGSGDEPLLGSKGVFEYQDRPTRDKGWAWAYFIVLGANAIIGVIGLLHIQSASSQYGAVVKPGYLSNATHCPFETGTTPGPEPASMPVKLPELITDTALTLLLSSAGPLVLGLLFLLSFKHAPRFTVWLTIVWQIAVPTLLSILCFWYKQIGVGLLLLHVALIIGLIFIIWRENIQLSIRIFGVAALALKRNSGLLFYVLLAKIFLLTLLLPLYFMQAGAVSFGKVLPNEARQGGAACTDTWGQAVPCCVWKTDAWVWYYLIFGVSTMLWTVYLARQHRLFVISGTVGQWYFAPRDAPKSKKAMIDLSARHASWSSFGSLTCGAAVLGPLGWARGIQRAGARGMPISNLLSCGVFPVLSILGKPEFLTYLTKFSPVMAAITGEGLVTAGQRSTELLNRTRVTNYTVWWFPSFMLHLAAFSLSGAWGGLTFLLYHIYFPDLLTDDEIWVLTWISFFLAWMVLSFLGSTVLDIINALYICYAIDKDNQAVTQPEVCDVYCEVAIVAAVEQTEEDVNLGLPQRRLLPLNVPLTETAEAQNAEDCSARV